MTYRIHPIAVFAIVALGLGVPLRAEEADPAARWVSAYGWLQTGERLGAANQWSLAMGSFIESFRQIETLAAEHPSFEPELIAYRLGKLEETIEAAEVRLSDDEHEIMMKYLDFIESFELGQSQRFRNEFEAALTTLDMANSLLEEIVERKPEEFRAAIETQARMVEESIAWLNTQVDFKALNRPVSYVGNSADWGTTRFVKLADLPASEEGGAPSGILFPGVLIATGARSELPERMTVESEVRPGAVPSGGSSSSSARSQYRFRMHSGTASGGAGDSAPEEKL